MKVVFLCASEYGFECLRCVCDILNCNVVGVITMPKQYEITYDNGRKSRIADNPILDELFEFCELGKKELFISKKVNSLETINKVKKWSPDLIIVSGWYQIIKKDILDLPSKGVIGLHASMLPQYRGGGPLVWQMINGEEYAGISLFYMDEGCDTGDIIAQKQVKICDGDTIKELYERVGKTGIDLLRENIPLIESGTANRFKQDDGYEGSVFPPRTEEDGLIDWRKSSKDIMNFVRAQTRPYPGAYTIIGNKKITIWDCSIEDI